MTSFYTLGVQSDVGETNNGVEHMIYEFDFDKIHIRLFWAGEQITSEVIYLQFQNVYI